MPLIHMLAMVLIILLFVVVALIMAFGDLELESMVVEASAVITTVVAGGSDVIDLAGALNEIGVGFTRKVIQLEVVNPTGAARIVSVWSADPTNTERLLIGTIPVAANATETRGLNNVRRPWRKVQPDDLTGIGPPLDRFNTQLRVNQDALPGAGCVVTARYYDSKYPY